MMRSPIEVSSSWSRRVLEAAWLAAVLAVPFACNPWGFNAFDLPKSALLRALALAVGAVLVLRLLDGWEPRVHLRRLPLYVPPVALLALTYCLATVLSSDPRSSIWGSEERQQGLVTLGACLVLFGVVAVDLRTPGQASRLLLAIAWGSVPVVAYGLWQAAGWDPLAWRSDSASPVHSTLGRSNFLGSYLVLAVPPSVALLLTTSRRWPFLLLVAAQGVCLAATGARSAWLGMAGAILVGGAVALLLAGRWRLALVTASFGILAVFSLVWLGVSGGIPDAWRAVPIVERFAALANPDGGSAEARLAIWRSTLQLLAERPLFGFGPETMRFAFAGVFPPELVYYQGRGVGVDRAHNLWLDLAMTGGLAAVAAFGVLLVTFVVTTWRGLRAAGRERERVYLVAVVAAISGHLVDLQFAFSTIATATVFWVLLGLGFALSRRTGGDLLSPNAEIRSRIDTGAPGKRGMAWILGQSTVVLACLALVGVLCLRPLLADAAYATAQGADSPVDGVAAARRAVSLWPLEPSYHVGLSWQQSRMGNFAAAEGELKQAARLSPNDYRIWAAMGDLYARWGASQPARYRQAEEAYRKVLSMASNLAAYHTALGLVVARQGRLDEGVGEVARAVDLDATDWIAYGHLAELYTGLGQMNSAQRAHEQAIYWHDKTTPPN